MQMYIVVPQTKRENLFLLMRYLLIGGSIYQNHPKKMQQIVLLSFLVSLRNTPY